MRETATVRATSVQFGVETFGAGADGGILLIMGAGASMLRWEEGFCEGLKAGRRLVIR